MIYVEVSGRPAPKGSMIAARTKDGKPYTRPASSYERPWINAVRDATREAMAHHGAEEPPYRVELTFRLNRPVRPTHDWPCAHDLDKLVRAVIDGLVKGGAMQDDRHVVTLSASKDFIEPGQQPGAVACVYHAAQSQRRAA